MRILHVEDDPQEFEFCKKRLEEGGNSVLHAATNAAAKNLLAKNEVEYCILDLAIPIDSPDGKPNVDHGIELAIHIRQHYPSIPILVLTGQSSEPATQALEEDDKFAFFWDGARKTLFKIRKKSKLDVALDLVNEAKILLDKLDEFELSLDDQYCRELPELEKRIVKLFGTKSGAKGAKVRRLSGGLSGAKVLRVALLNEIGNEFQSAVCKIDNFENAKHETINFDTHVTSLGVGSFPTWLGEFFVGCGNKSGVFFQLANNYQQTFFDVVAESDDRASNVLSTLREYEKNWHTNFRAETISIEAIRRSQLSDEKFEAIKSELTDIDVDEFEKNMIQIRLSVQHGDHHGANVLVSEANDPVIIDYGDIGEFACCLDPIVLELSSYFHPDSRSKFKGNDEIADNWFSDDRKSLLAVVQNPLSVGVLREWSDDNAFSLREIAAVTYAYCVRQLSYEGTDKELAKKLAKKAVEVIG